jgi:hypothetical protein
MKEKREIVEGVIGTVVKDANEYKFIVSPCTPINVIKLITQNGALEFISLLAIEKAMSQEGSLFNVISDDSSGSLDRIRVEKVEEEIEEGKASSVIADIFRSNKNISESILHMMVGCNIKSTDIIIYYDNPSLKSDKISITKVAKEILIEECKTNWINDDNKTTKNN